MSFAMVFPGQGSQSVGMLAALGGTDPVVRQTFEEASGVLGYDLWQLAQQGPEAELNATERTQPAMLCAGVATFRAWIGRGGPLPATVSGHSLGEFTALVCAGALDFGAAIDLVRFRGQAMQAAVPAGSGAMAAILGLEDAVVEEACREAAQGEVVAPANFNAPSQVVIAGHASAVERAIALARARGARRAVPLAVSVPAHSALMQPAGERLRERLAAIELREPRLRYVSAVDAEAHDGAGLRELLVRQLASPVRWTRTVQALAASGARRIIECGPGKVLTGLDRRICPDLQHLALEDGAAIETALAACRGGDAT